MKLSNMLTGPLSALGAGLSGSQNSSNLANTAGILSDRQWAEDQAQKQMDFQREMSSTSYQRAIEDMKKAGLNPALAYMQGGASSAAGAAAQTSSTEQKAVLQRERLMFQLLNSALQIAGKAVPQTRHSTSVSEVYKTGR